MGEWKLNSSSAHSNNGYGKSEYCMSYFPAEGKQEVHLASNLKKPRQVNSAKWIPKTGKRQWLRVSEKNKTTEKNKQTNGFEYFYLKMSAATRCRKLHAPRSRQGRRRGRPRRPRRANRTRVARAHRRSLSRHARRRRGRRRRLHAVAARVVEVARPLERTRVVSTALQSTRIVSGYRMS